jgi:uncharacterized protein (TIGR02145 family)
MGTAVRLMGFIAIAAALTGCGDRDGDANDDVVSAVNTAAIAAGTASAFEDSRDGKVYGIIQAGGQTWFAENLNYDAEGSVCYENKAENCAKYGRLYNWETALTACPVGTHLPADEEWKTLMYYVSGLTTAIKNGDDISSLPGVYDNPESEFLHVYAETAGTKLKSSKGWESYNDVPAGTNEYGFSSLPGGCGDSDGGFGYADRYGFWWSATEYGTDGAWHRGMYYDIEDMFRLYNNKIFLLSVRCILD